jgi:hypothetical protein
VGEEGRIQILATAELGGAGRGAEGHQRDRMRPLTRIMRSVLGAADVEAGEINDVPFGTMSGLEARGFIDRTWRRAGGPRTTRPGRFPHYHGVKLTEAGRRAVATAKARPESS